MLGLLALIAALFVAEFAGTPIRRNEADQRTANALAQAKEALIGYAANYPRPSKANDSMHFTHQAMEQKPDNRYCS